jgi:hypothetical protein
MYTKFPGGWHSPGGLIVPCDVEREVKDERGGLTGAYVRLTDEKGIYSWVIYVRASQLMNDDEVE